MLLLLLYNGGEGLRRETGSIGCIPSTADRLLQGKLYTLHAKLLNFPTKFFGFYRMSTFNFNKLALSTKLIPIRNNCSTDFLP